MAEKSEFDRGGDGMTRGGLDRFLGPPASDNSHMPPAIEDEKADPYDRGESIDCSGKDVDEAVCEIAKAEEAEREGGTTAT
jgi:hypothetical protein